MYDSAYRFRMLISVMALFTMASGKIEAQMVGLSSVKFYLKRAHRR